MKKENKLVTNLASLDNQILAEFIASLYGEDEFLDSKIERLLLSSDSDALTTLLKKEIASLKRSKRYIDYYESAGFSNAISELQREIENNVLPVLPDQAFKLVDSLLRTAENSLERCDDSNGYIGDTYREICLLWLKAASMSSAPKSGWMNAVKLLASNNDYGVLDALLPNAHILLADDELHQLASYYEEGLRDALNNKSDRMDYLSQSVNLHSVAEALKDPDMYLRATLLVSPSPNYLQIEDMVRFFMRCGAHEQAIKWLKNDWGNESRGKPNAIRLSLLADSYLALNQHDQHRMTLIELLSIDPTYSNLQKTLPLVSAKEAEKLRTKFIAAVLNESDIYAKLSPLLQLEEYAQAEDVAINNMAALESCSYTTLLSLLDLTPEDLPLLRIILLRCLLGDILHRGKTQAYHYAAGYLKKLDRFDQKSIDYRSLPNHADFMVNVKEKHGRKSSFWSKYNAT